MPKHKDDKVSWFHLILQKNCLNLRLIGAVPNAPEWFRLSVSLTTLTAEGVALFKSSRGYLSRNMRYFFVNIIINHYKNLSTIF